MPWGMPNFQYSEDISLQNWELHDDTLSVGGYLCQKATCNFRGRNYTSWFTVDIPVSNGPWKFGGLPGLILKVYDDDNLYTFECVSIENYPIKYPIQMYDAYKNYSKTEHKKFLKLLKNVYADYFTAAGIISLSDNINKSVPFHPLELE
jgi:GLPGLI family protein